MTRLFRIGRQSAARLLRLILGSVLVVVVAALVSAIGTRLFFTQAAVVPAGFTGDFFIWLRWQLTVWAPWILFGPLVVLYAEHLMVRFRGGWRRVAAHLAVGTAILGLNGCWYVLATVSPALGVAEFFRMTFGGEMAIYMVYTRWMMPVLIAVYLGMVMWATQGLLVGLRSASGGMIDEGGTALGETQRRLALLAFDGDDLSILAVNTTAVRLYGRPAGELVGSRVTDLMTHEAAARFRTDHAATRGSFLWRGRGTHMGAEAREITVEFLCQQVTLDRRVAELLLVSDLTEDMRALQQLRESERKAADLKLQLANARLRALQLQLKPHFLFNTLNSVAMMIRTGDHEDARVMVTMLGDMFRFLLEFEGEAMVPLRQEVEFVNLYLGLQQRRFLDRVKLDQRIDESALEIPVPTLILQPLVENAVHHGVGGMAGACSIVISARRMGARLQLRVENDVGSSPGRPVPSHGHGVGQRNTQTRLAGLYGAAARFHAELRGARYIVSLEIPI